MRTGLSVLAGAASPKSPDFGPAAPADMLRSTGLSRRPSTQRLPQKKAENVAALRKHLGELVSPHLTCPPGPEPHCLSTSLDTPLGHGFFGKGWNGSSEVIHIWDHGKAAVMGENHEQILTRMGQGTDKF